jgi:hypothetical protein
VSAWFGFKIAGSSFKVNRLSKYLEEGLERFKKAFCWSASLHRFREFRTQTGTIDLASYARNNENFVLVKLLTSDS